ncbi:hypothetical protein ACFL9T_01040 [Thermodesulfobacteriota bacterium]
MISSKTKKFQVLITAVILFFLFGGASGADSTSGEPYQAAAGLIDLRSTFSDGKHAIEELVKMAAAGGFRVLFINDHDRIAISYGIPPFRHLLRYKREYPSIMTHGPEKFLAEINRVSEKYPHMILIPGCITSSYYYMTRSWFKFDLTAHEYDRKILALNLEEPDDYRLMPNLHNSLSLKYTKKLLPGLVVYIVPLLIGLYLLRWKGSTRIAAFALILFSILAIMDYNPMRSSLYSQYAGNQGIQPFQDMIHYINKKGGYAFWNYPEQKSGTRDLGPINLDTPPYPQVLYESRDYCGFAAIYGENTTITDPGREWDQVLREFCEGKRKSPSWGIGTADFHEEGRLGLKLGQFPTVFLVKDLSKEGILEAMKKGRMYAALGDGHSWPSLDYFNVLDGEGERAHMGDTLTTARFPTIKFRVSYPQGESKPRTIWLIRDGKLLKTFKSETPMEVEFHDGEATAGKKTYYRLMDSRKRLISNPIFVVYNPSR